MLLCHDATVTSATLPFRGIASAKWINLTSRAFRGSMDGLAFRHAFSGIRCYAYRLFIQAAALVARRRAAFVAVAATCGEVFVAFRTAVFSRLRSGDSGGEPFGRRSRGHLCSAALDPDRLVGVHAAPLRVQPPDPRRLRQVCRLPAGQLVDDLLCPSGSGSARPDQEMNDRQAAR